MPNFRSINWHPLATNILDAVGRTDLVDEAGRRVEVKREGTYFGVYVAGQPWLHEQDNLSASYALNYLNVGVYDGSTEVKDPPDHRLSSPPTE